MNKTAWIHPELLEGEIFVENVRTAIFNRSLWTTKRLGNMAYILVNGVPIKIIGDFFPMFVNLQEMEKKCPERLSVSGHYTY